MSRARAASEEPATDAVKRSGDMSVDELFSAKRPRLSDYRVLETSQYQQNRIFSEDSDNGGVLYVSHKAPTSVEPEKPDEDGSIALIVGPGSCDTENGSPDPPVGRQISVAKTASSPVATQTPYTDYEKSPGGNELTTKDSQDATASSEEEHSPGDLSTRGLTPPSGVDVDKESVEDSQEMWTSATSSEISEDKGVELDFSGRLDHTFFRPVSLPENTIPATVEEKIGAFKAHIDDAFSSFQREIQSVLGVEDKSSIIIMKDMLAEKDGIISLLKAEIDQLRSELEKCRELVHQHGKETEEWADRMMNLICRLPGLEGVDGVEV